MKQIIFLVLALIALTTVPSIYAGIERNRIYTESHGPGDFDEVWESRWEVSKEAFSFIANSGVPVTDDTKVLPRLTFESGGSVESIVCVLYTSKIKGSYKFIAINNKKLFEACKDLDLVNLAQFSVLDSEGLILDPLGLLDQNFNLFLVIPIIERV